MRHLHIHLLKEFRETKEKDPFLSESTAQTGSQSSELYGQGNKSISVEFSQLYMLIVWTKTTSSRQKNSMCGLSFGDNIFKIVQRLKVGCAQLKNLEI